MFTAYDFINDTIEPKQMKFGWKIETGNSLSCGTYLILRYTMTNFDWDSLKYLNGECWNMLLNSNAYNVLKEKNEKAMKKYKKLYFEGYSIDELQSITEYYKLKINVEKMVNRLIKKKSEKTKENIEEKKKLGII